MKKELKKISIIIPVYNERDCLESSVRKVINFLNELKVPYELIIAEDGSTDGTNKIASKLASEIPNVIHLHDDRRLGKGKAISKGFINATGDILIFMDCDLSTDITHIKDAIKEIEKGNDIVIGSRLLKDSRIKRSLKREILSRWYNILVRLIHRSRIKDHQCGFKAFRREVAIDLLKYTRDTHWFWDTEILIIAQRKGYKIKEIPVYWIENKYTKVKIIDILYLLRRIISLRIRFFFDKL